MPKRPPLLILVGPTAVGKTALSIELALRLQGEIVSADSMQVYRGMDVGTAKPRPVETKGVPHHLIDVVDPQEDFNVAIYRDLARQAIGEIHERGQLPILSGGTGLYIKAVVGEFLFPDTGASRQTRAELAAFAQEQGPQALHQRLQRVDPQSAQRLHPHDVRRVTRALEIYLRTGTAMSVHLTQAKQKEADYRLVYVGLTRLRQTLYERIDQRVLLMIKQGLLQETESLWRAGVLEPGTPAGQALGYKEMLAHLEGQIDLPEAIANLQQGTRHYAKRQYTWFRRQANLHWYDLDLWPQPDAAAELMIPYLRHRLAWY